MRGDKLRLMPLNVVMNKINRLSDKKKKTLHRFQGFLEEILSVHCVDMWHFGSAEPRKSMHCFIHSVVQELQQSVGRSKMRQRSFTVSAAISSLYCILQFAPSAYVTHTPQPLIKRVVLGLRLPLMESWLTEKWFGPTISGRLNQTVMFHRCDGVMNMNCRSRIDEFPAFILAQSPREGVTCNELTFFLWLLSFLPANWLSDWLSARPRRTSAHTEDL